MDVLFACLVAPVLALMFVFGALRWTAGPLLNAGRTTHHASNFFLTDLIWLVLQLQVAMAVVASAFPADMPTYVRVWAMVLLCVPVLMFWLASLQVVSRAGIRQPLRRAIVFVVLLPGVALTVLGLPLVAIGFLRSLGPSHTQGPSGQSPLVLGCLLAALAAFSLSLRWLAQWAIATPKSPLP